MESVWRQTRPDDVAHRILRHQVVPGVAVLAKGGQPRAEIDLRALLPVPVEVVAPQLCVVRQILCAECQGHPPELDLDVQRLLERYHWPGNIRQLSNVLRTAAVMAGAERTITRSHLSDDFIEDAQRVMARQPLRAAADGEASWPNPVSPAAAAPVHDAAQPAHGAADSATLEELELQTIQRVVKEVNGNISLASKRLGISRNTIYRKLGRR